LFLSILGLMVEILETHIIEHGKKNQW